MTKIPTIFTSKIKIKKATLFSSSKDNSGARKEVKRQKEKKVIFRGE